MRYGVVFLLAFFGVCFSEEQIEESNLEEVEYYSQYQQDKYLNEFIFKGKKNGFFIEIGAADGIDLSNSYFFEKNLGWNGICVEPVPVAFTALRSNRSCNCLNAAIFDYTGTVDFCWIEALRVLPGYDENRSLLHMANISGILSEFVPEGLERMEYYLQPFEWRKNIIQVNAYSFNDMMDLFGVTKVDFVTIDTEGGEEKITRAIDFDKYTIDVFYIECNFGDDISDFMNSKGYVLVERSYCDLLFIRQELYDSLGLAHILDLDDDDDDEETS